jgi:hypothetical protein
VDARDADTRDADAHDADTRDADARDADTRDADTRDVDTRDVDIVRDAINRVSTISQSGPKTVYGRSTYKRPFNHIRQSARWITIQ